MNEFGVLMIGFLLGIKHATEADHLAAVATLVTRHHSFAQSIRHGAAWGIGHTLTLMLFGGLVLALGTSVSQHLALVLEIAVGGMLIGLGGSVLYRLARQRIHVHIHTHQVGVRHVHVHSHAALEANGDAAHEHAHAAGLPMRALAVGMTHGMAGTAALVVLSLGAVQSWTAGLAYIGLFGAGSIVGMALLSVVIAIPLRLTAPRLGKLYTGLTALIGGCSCALGMFIVYRFGVAEALHLGWLSRVA